MRADKASTLSLDVPIPLSIGHSPLPRSDRLANGAQNYRNTSPFALLIPIVSRLLRLLRPQLWSHGSPNPLSNFGGPVYIFQEGHRDQIDDIFLSLSHALFHNGEHLQQALSGICFASTSALWNYLCKIVCCLAEEHVREERSMFMQVRFVHRAKSRNCIHYPLDIFLSRHQALPYLKGRAQVVKHNTSSSSIYSRGTGMFVQPAFQNIHVLHPFLRMKRSPDRSPCSKLLTYCVCCASHSNTILLTCRIKESSHGHTPNSTDNTAASRLRIHSAKRVPPRAGRSFG